MAKHHPNLVMCRKQPGVAVGQLCDKCQIFSVCVNQLGLIDIFICSSHSFFPTCFCCCSNLLDCIANQKKKSFSSILSYVMLSYILSNLNSNIVLKQKKKNRDGCPKLRLSKIKAFFGHPWSLFILMHSAIVVLLD